MLWSNRGVLQNEESYFDINGKDVAVNRQCADRHSRAIRFETLPCCQNGVSLCSCESNIFLQLKYVLRNGNCQKAQKNAVVACAKHPMGFVETQTCGQLRVKVTSTVAISQRREI